MAIKRRKAITEVACACVVETSQLAIKNIVPELGIQVQFEPPENLDDMKLLYEAGVEAVGIHLESFSQDTRERITPGKAK